MTTKGKNTTAVSKNPEFLQMVVKHKNAPGEIKKLVDLASKSEIDACCEVYLNALKGHINLTPRLAGELHKRKKDCSALLKKNTPLSKKKKILKGQVGGFLPAILGLAAPLLGSVLGAITGRK